MRILRGFIGCWLGLFAAVFTTVYMPLGGTTENMVSNLAAAMVAFAFIPTVVFGVFEKATSAASWYVGIGAAMAVVAVCAVIAASGPLPNLGVAREAVDFLIALGCAAFGGAITGGAYRLFAGAKQA